MKILFVSQVPDSRLMGVPRVLYCVGDELEKLGHEVSYFFEADGPKCLIKKAALLEWSIRVAPKIGERCRQQNIDAVIVTSATGWALSTFRRWLLPEKTKVISWHHGYEELMWQQMLLEEQTGRMTFSPQFKAYYGGGILWALRQSLKTQDGAIFTSSQEANFVRTEHAEFKATHEAHFLPNGVTENYFDSGRFDRPMTDDSPKLLFVGYWDPWRKGRQYLIEAFSQLHMQYPDLKLTLAGTAVSAEQVLSDFPESCRNAISVIPKANESELGGLYQTHDIFLLPSLFEGMPLVLLEAMASGMACITTDACGMRDVIQDGTNGILIPRRDSVSLISAIDRMIKNPDLRSRLGYEASKSARQAHSWPQITRQCEAILERIVHST